MKGTFIISVLAVLHMAIATASSDAFGNIRLTPRLRAACVPVKANGKNAFVEVLSKGLESDINVPTLIFHIKDLENFSSLPLPDTIAAAPAGSVASDGKFDVSGSVGEDKYLNSYLVGDSKDEHFKLHFDVTDSGLYCVYVDPAADVVSYDLPIIVRNSYGYLNFYEYIEVSESRWGLLLYIAVTAWLLRDLIRSVGKDFSNLNNISVVSKSAVFLILMPYIGIMIMTLASDFILNCVAEKGFLICISIMLLLFCMGYGVVFYHRQTKSYRQLPAPKMRMAKILGGIQLALVCVNGMFMVFASNPSSDLAAGSANSFPVVEGALVLFQFILYTTSIIQGVKTLRNIKEFPPYGSSVEDYGEKNEGIRVAFKRSLCLIFLVPMLFGVGAGIIAGVSGGANFIQDFGPNVDPALVSYLTLDMLIKDSTFLYFQTWNMIVTTLVVIIGVFFIWIKGNQGLVVDDKEYFEAPAYGDSDPESV
ncbi:hypothetical protein PSN45_002335 [Yamadazyma tenuis]|uniref:uncharacterized protein n=1 Tax=Candida tenuis TaxID=2315449 RepID=UPI002798B2B5|nr:hypothetical protein PSN45_002335 [Yamadazyma tenuis]